MHTLSSEVRGVRPPRLRTSIVRALLASSALIAIIAANNVALADGGNGGGPGGGAGGVGTSGNPGADGTQPIDAVGGGGGGGAGGGGAGGNGAGGAFFGVGGAGGTALAPNGMAGGDSGLAAGGGGGGFNGLPIGGNGGNGGNNTGTLINNTNNTTQTAPGGGGGGGGGFGFGTGGNGGNGGRGGSINITSTSTVSVQNIARGGGSGGGGDGGIGNVQSGSGATGGIGGAGGIAGDGTAGATTTSIGSFAISDAFGGTAGKGGNGGNGTQQTTSSALTGQSLAGAGGQGGSGGAATGTASSTFSGTQATVFATGGNGADGGNGGIGVQQAGSFVINANTVGGGGGGGDGGTGGSASATSNNGGAGGQANATATGGNGGNGGNGGAGVVVTGSNVVVTNSAVVISGNGRVGGTGGDATATATSLAGQAPAVATAGNGGNGGIGAGGAIFNGSGVTFTNSGSVSAGAGGSGGTAGAVSATATSNVLGTATENAGNGGNAGAGGVGVLFSQAGATFNNSGSVLGGSGGIGGIQSSSGIGGAGGAGGRGGEGVSFQGSGAALVNSGSITGGRGGEGGNFGAQNNAGFSAAAVVFARTGTITNTATGTIAGGQGPVQGAGGIVPGAVGIIGGGLTIMNDGTISGGLDSANVIGRSPAIEFTGGANAVGGSGTINGGIQLDAGSLMPAVSGSTVGQTLNVNGVLYLDFGTTYVIRVNGAANDSVTSTGIAQIFGGSVSASVSGNALGRHTIITASSVTGTFAGLTTTGNSAFLQAALSYDPTHAYLTFTGNGSNGGIDFTSAAQNVNQTNVASALNTGGAANGFSGPLINLIAGLSAAQAQAAFTALDGEAATGAERAAFRFGDQFLNLMLDPFVEGHFGNVGGGGFNGFAPEQQAELPAEISSAYASVFKAAPPMNFEQRWSIWNAAFGGSGKTNGDPAVGSNDTRLSTYGFAGGIDYRFSPYTMVGLAAAGGGTNWNLTNALGGGRSESAQVGAYARTAIGPAYIAESINFAGNWFNTNRTALGANLRATFTGESLGARIEGGYRIAVAPNFGITPYAAGQAQAFHSGAYGEIDVNNAGFGLNYAAKEATDIRSELGARVDLPTLLAGTPFIVRGRFAWAHDFVETPSLDAAFQTLPLSNFTVFGAKIPHDSGLASFGVDWYLNRDWKLLAKFDGEFAKGSDIYAGTVALRYNW